MTLSQYLGRGSTSRGRTTIGLGLNMVVSTLPWLQNDGDTEAVVTSIEHVVSALSTVQNLTFLQPASNVTAADYVANVTPPSSLTTYTKSNNTKKH